MCGGSRLNPDRAPRAPDGFDQHAVVLDALTDQGSVVLGGLLGDDVDAGDALLVVWADDEPEVHALLAADPRVGFILTIKSVQRWSVWLRSEAL